ncbi:MAG: dimethyladenosine transferase [Odoribacter sp.]|nr:dimethyladenosine transferase [Odoribacter sp.]
MNKFLFPIYRIVVPKPLRTIILKQTLRKKILKYFASVAKEKLNDEQQDVLRYLEKNPVETFPYPFSAKYSPDNVEVFFDDKRGMRYVLMENKRLYFKKRWSERRIKKGYSDLMREQDSDSPHLYLTDKFNVGSDDVVADIGAAEGNFSLSVIEKVKRIYIFEHDKEWSEALEATFAPWKDKVEVINKRVAGFNDPGHIKFDTFFSDKKDINFLKIDVDGAEQQVLNSCTSILETEGPVRIALCTYHKNNDEQDFTELLNGHGFSVIPSKGYMVHYFDKMMKAPYLRRGLIRAVK